MTVRALLLAPDGRVVVSVIDERERQSIVVWNFFQELKAKVGN